MFQKLRDRWKVNGLNLALIIITFALGGSLCGYLGRKLLLFTGLEKNVLWFVLYIILITLLWPLCVLLISIPLGQFRFFLSYIKKIGRKMSGRKAVASQNTVNQQDNPKKIAIFASGAGSNARKIMEYFAGSKEVQVALIVCNKPGAGVIDIARQANIPVLMLDKDRFFAPDHYIKELQGIDLIVLAGFLWKIPSALVQAFSNRIVNIHPALLPKYGGKGMYGQRVHEAVIAAGDAESGISIHYVDEIYDHGQIILQATCSVDPGDTADSLAQKVHALEHAHYPPVIAELLQKQNRS